MEFHANSTCLQPAQTCLCIICGLPAAGKSTLSKVVSSWIRKQGWISFIICYDDLIPEKAFDFKRMNNEDPSLKQTEWKWHRQAVLQGVEQILQNSNVLLQPSSLGSNSEEVCRRLIHAAQEQRVFVPPSSVLPHPPIIFILDDNFYYSSMRYEVHQLARKYSLGFCQVYLHCPVSSCLSRNHARPKPLPEEVIVEMAERMESPNPPKNPWEQRSITLNSTNNFTQEDVQVLIDLFSTALKNPLSPVQDNTDQKERDRISCASSIVHQADQSCRSLVSQAMFTARENKLPKDCMRSLAKEFSELKTSFLQNLRKHVLQDHPVLSGEPIDTEQVVRRAVQVFDSDKDDILRRYCAKPP